MSLVTHLAAPQFLLIVGPIILSTFQAEVACFIETSMSSLLHGGNTEDYNLNRQVPTVRNSISLSNEIEIKKIYIREHVQWQD